METILIKRDTGNYQYEVVKKLETSSYLLVILKNKEPIWGGLYCTSLLTKYNTEIKNINGLCLGAAMEVFTELKKLINQ